jgi:predicted MPP superfamily phosphohydrolase
VQLSDMHMGSFYSAADLARAVDAANGLRADLMLVTGDLITDRYDPLDRCLLELKRLRAASGIWGCLGNHEMQAHVQAYTTRKARDMGMRFLRQEVEVLQFGGAKLNLVGVDHQRRSRPYLAHTAGLVAPGAFNVLLSHNPDVFPVAVKQGFDLTIAGHTHGGQINLNLLGSNINIADLVTPFTKGAYHIDHSSLYVNSGLGTIGVPVRLGSPPEVTLITLCNS